MADKDKILDVRAAYFGMISYMDNQAVMVRQAWEECLKAKESNL